MKRLSSSIIGIAISICKPEVQQSTINYLCSCNNTTSNDNSLLGRYIYKYYFIYLFY